MKFPFRTFFSTGILLIFLSGRPAVLAQPFIWKVHDMKTAESLFSVRADTVFGLSSDLYAAELSGETILFRNDPFHPLSRTENKSFRPLNEHFFAAGNRGGWQLYHTANASLARTDIFSDFQFWRNSLLAKLEKGFVYFPPGGEDILADSVQVLGPWLILYKSDGIFLVDSSSAVKYFHSPAKNRRFNIPWFSSLLNDSTWISLKGEFSFIEKRNSFWWNDSSLLDSNAAGVYLQSPTIRRKKLADTLSVESSEVLWMKTGKRSFLYFSNGRKIPLRPHSARKAINDSLCAVRYPEGWTFHSKGGNKYSLKPVISDIGPCIGNLILVRSNRRWGCVDPSGIIRISCRYDSILPMSEGLMGVKIGRVWGFLDKDERIRIQPNYEWIEPFSDSVCLARLGEKFGLLHISGEPVLPFQYDSISSLPSGNRLLKAGKWLGLGNFKGKILLKPRYSDIIELHSGLIRVERDSRFGMFGSEGNPLLPLESVRIVLDKANGVIISR